MTIEIVEALAALGAVAGGVALGLHFRGKTVTEAAKAIAPATVEHVQVVSQQVKELTDRLNLTTQVAAVARDVARNHEEVKASLGDVHAKLDEALKAKPAEASKSN